MLVFGQCAVASLRTLQRVEEEREKKKKKMVENAFLTDQCTKFIFALLLCWFYLIRTQAFSVFSEVSCGGTAVRQNNTQMSESLKQQLYEQKRRPVDDLVLIPRCNLFFWGGCFFLDCFLNSLQPTQLAEFTSSISLPQFLSLTFSCSPPHSLSRREDFWFESNASTCSATSFQCSPPSSVVLKAFETSAHRSSLVPALSRLLTKRNVWIFIVRCCKVST